MAASDRLSDVFQQSGALPSSSPCGDCLVVVDAKRRILALNSSAERALGWRRQQALGRYCRDVLEAIDPAGICVCDDDCMAQHAFSAREPIFGRTLLVRRRGSGRLLCSVAAIPLWDEQQSPIGLLHAFRRVPDRPGIGTRYKDHQVSLLATVVTLACSAIPMEEMLTRALDRILEALGLDAGAILCLDDRGRPLGWPVRRGITARHSEQLASLGLCENLIREVAGSCRPLLLDGLPDEPPAGHKRAGERLRSVGYVPLAAHGITLGVMILGSRRPQAFGTAAVRLLDMVGHQLGLALENVYLHGEALLLQKEKTDLSRERLVQVNRAQEEERKRLARDLHDDVLQSIALVIADLEFCRRNQALPAATREELDSQSRTLRAVLDATRRIVADLRLASLDNIGLIGSLEGSLLQRFRREAGCEVVLEHRGWPLDLSRALGLNIYRLIQEALTNVRKHARAKQVRITLDGGDTHLEVRVSDDGIGFDPQAVFTERQQVNYLGLVGLRERAALLGGQLYIESATGRGTTIRVVVPREQRGEELSRGGY